MGFLRRGRTRRVSVRLRCLAAHFTVTTRTVDRPMAFSEPRKGKDVACHVVNKSSSQRYGNRSRIDLVALV